MRFAVFTLIVAMSISTPAMAELNWKTNRTIIPLTKRQSQWKDTVNLNAFYSYIESIDAKILRGLENYERNTGIPHPLAVKLFGPDPVKPIRKRANPGVALIGSEDNWYTTIWVGTPARPFTVQIDTGCSDLFVPGPSCLHCEGHMKWDPESSQTSVNQHLGFELDFEDGNEVAGEQYTDNVTITGLTADRQTIGVAIIYTPGMAVDQFPPDGMLGLAFQSISAYPASPLFQTLVDEQKVQEPVFSIKLTSSGGELYLGGSNTDLYTGDITYTDVTEEGFWQVNIGRIQGNNKIPLKNVPAMLDTGGKYIIGDLTRVSLLYKALGGIKVGRGFYSFPCDAFPTISFTFGDSDRTFQIPPSLLNLGPVEDDSHYCFSAIVGQRSLVPWTIGNVFLMGVYTVFDFGNKRVGFADLAA